MEDVWVAADAAAGDDVAEGPAAAKAASAAPNAASAVSWTVRSQLYLKAASPFDEPLQFGELCGEAPSGREGEDVTDESLIEEMGGDAATAAAGAEGVPATAAMRSLQPTTLSPWPTTP